MADRAAMRRMEVLEWIIIVVITFSITISLLPQLSSHSTLERSSDTTLRHQI
jgi:uncharacterized Rmd1/YagE family protein